MKEEGKRRRKEMEAPVGFRGRRGRISIHFLFAVH